MHCDDVESVVPERLVIISDCTDCAYAEMRGAILRSAAQQDPTRVIQIEPLVSVRSYSVINTAFVLRLLAEAYPLNTMFMVIMNSLQQRTERIVGRTKVGSILFEGTNTGAMGWLVTDFGVSECYELTDPGFVPFGGKYVHAPAVGKILVGVPLAQLGTPFSVDRIRYMRVEPGVLVHVDNFGNGKFLMAGQYRPGAKLRVTLGGATFNACYGERMMSHADGTWVVYPGSSMDLHEIGQVRGPGLLSLSVEPGSVLTIHGLDAGE